MHFPAAFQHAASPHHHYHYIVRAIPLLLMVMVRAALICFPSDNNHILLLGHGHCCRMLSFLEYVVLNIYSFVFFLT